MHLQYLEKEIIIAKTKITSLESVNKEKDEKIKILEDHIKAIEALYLVSSPSTILIHQPAHHLLLHSRLTFWKKYLPLKHSCPAYRIFSSLSHSNTSKPKTFLPTKPQAHNPLRQEQALLLHQALPLL